MHLYGRDITFDYVPLAGEKEIAGLELISARLYGPNDIPNDEQLLDTDKLTTGHIGDRVESWTLMNPQGTGPAFYRLTFPALEDDEPVSTVEFDTFIVALNYRAQAGGPELRNDKQIEVYRPDGLTSKIEVTAEHVFGVESKIKKLKGILWTEGKIELAREELLSRLEGRGYASRRLFNLHKLNLATKLLATAYACDDLAGEDNQSWAAKATKWRKLADEMFNIAKVGYDTAGQGRPNPEQKVSGGGSVIYSR